MRVKYFFRTVRNRCPKIANEGTVLKGLFHRNEKCSNCDFVYSREDGFLSGWNSISYGLICGLWIVPLLTIWFFDLIPTNWMLGLIFGGAICLPILTYRYSQCLWLGIYFTFAEHEMPGISNPE